MELRSAYGSIAVQKIAQDRAVTAARSRRFVGRGFTAFEYYASKGHFVKVCREL